MNEIKEYTEKVFEDIKHIDENVNEYWLARELMEVLEYTLWQRFSNVIKKAMENCKNSNNIVLNHFISTDKMVQIGSNTERKIQDYKLSRYACYLIVLNCDPRKKVIALAKTYFAIQTRKQELTEKEYSELTEDEKRFYQRDLTRKGNYSLNIAARNAGVKNFDRFHNFGYKGLYNGETANDIAKRKNLRYREDILMYIDYSRDDAVWFFNTNDVIKISPDMELYVLLDEFMKQEYTFSNDILKNYKDRNRLTWYSDCYYNPDDEWSIAEVSCLYIERKEDDFNIWCAKKLDDIFNRTDKTYAICFSPCGNGKHSRNLKTGLTLQDDFIVLIYQQLIKNNMKLCKSKKQ